MLIVICTNFAYGDVSSCSVLSLAVVPLISIAVQKFGRYLRELSHTTQAAAAGAASIAEVCDQNLKFVLPFVYS